MVRKTPSLQGCMVYEIQFFLQEGREDDMLKLSQFQLEMSAGWSDLLCIPRMKEPIRKLQGSQ